MNRFVNHFLIFSFSLLVPAHTAFAVDPTAPNYGNQAKEVMEHIQKKLYDPKTGLYNKSEADAKPDYIWREAAMFSALVGAARHDRPTYGPLMQKHFAAMEVY